MLSAINTPTYKLAKFLVPHFTPLTKNEYTVSDSFSFAEEIRNQDTQLFMASLDVDSLFTNVPLNETIDICVELFKDRDSVAGLGKTDFHQLLSLAAKQSYFTFEDDIYIISPLGPSFANAFLCHHEKEWLQQCPSEFKPVYYRRYVDVVLFSSPLPLFQVYLNSKHQNISFTTESEHDNQLPFLDVFIRRDNGTFCTSVYRKPTFSGVYSNFYSFMPQLYKLNLI